MLKYYSQISPYTYIVTFFYAKNQTLTKLFMNSCKMHRKKLSIRVTKTNTKRYENP